MLLIWVLSVYVVDTNLLIEGKLDGMTNIRL